MSREWDDRKAIAACGKALGGPQKLPRWQFNSRRAQHDTPMIAMRLLCVAPDLC
jgi:hypothetical protein